MSGFFSAHVVICGLTVLSISFSSKATVQEPCIYPSKFADEMAIFQNAKGGWDAHCSGRFVGLHFVRNGINETDAEMMVQKGNLVRQEGQQPSSAEQFAKGAILLYQIIAGENTIQFAQMLTNGMLNNYFGASNQFLSMGVNAPPQFYTDPDCYGVADSVAQTLRNATIDAMYQGNLAFIQNLAERFAPHCDGRDSSYDLAVKGVCAFFDVKYQYCLKMLGGKNE